MQECHLTQHAISKARQEVPPSPPPLAGKGASRFRSSRASARSLSGRSPSVAAGQGGARSGAPHLMSRGSGRSMDLRIVVDAIRTLGSGDRIGEGLVAARETYLTGGTAEVALLPGRCSGGSGPSARSSQSPVLQRRVTHNSATVNLARRAWASGGGPAPSSGKHLTGRSRDGSLSPREQRRGDKTIASIDMIDITAEGAVSNPGGVEEEVIGTTDACRPSRQHSISRALED